VLLSSNDLEPVEVLGPNEPSAFFIVCDHAGRMVPRALESLGLSDDELGRHIAWDIGAAAVARRLAEALSASAILQRYSRLVIDCNRPLDATDSIVRRSEATDVPGNLRITQADAHARANAVFHPYHDAIRDALDGRAAQNRPTVLVALHSFTPVLLAQARPWHAGVLHNRDARLAAPLLAALRSEADLVVGDNEPYAASDRTDYTLVNHGERRGIPCVELEIRQDLIATSEGQCAWAERLARLLPVALASFDPTAAKVAARPKPPSTE